MFWRIKFGEIALIRQIRQTLVTPNFRRSRYCFKLDVKFLTLKEQCMINKIKYLDLPSGKIKPLKIILLRIIVSILWFI